MRGQSRIHHFFSQISESVRAFSVFKINFLVFLFSFTMVIKGSLGGESEFGNRPAYSMSKFSAAVKL